MLQRTSEPCGRNRTRIANGLATLVFCVLIIAFTTPLNAKSGDLQREASWSIPSFDDVRAKIMDLAKASDANELTVAKIEVLWADDTIATDQLAVMRQFVESLPILFPETKGICERTLSESVDQRNLDATLLDDPQFPESVRNNLRLGIARALVLSSLFDEALVHFDKLKTDDVVDPATMLYFRAICQRNLLDRDGCIKTVELLMENEELIPARYRRMGELIASDIKALESDSLDEIARLMADIERRQKLNRSGQKVIGQEEDVISKLDKMIEDMEKQAQQQMAMAEASPSSSSPMEDSSPGGGRGAGDVDEKRQEDGGKWGDLPPRQREAAMADLVKDLPPHYRQVIEEYFKKLARDEPRQ